MQSEKRHILGTTIFDGNAAVRGYGLNAMCCSFNDQVNHAAFLADEEGYCARFDFSAGRWPVNRHRILGLTQIPGRFDISTLRPANSTGGQEGARVDRLEIMGQ